MWARGSHPDYDAHGWGFMADSRLDKTCFSPSISTSSASLTGLSDHISSTGRWWSLQTRRRNSPKQTITLWMQHFWSPTPRGRMTPFKIWTSRPPWWEVWVMPSMKRRIWMWRKPTSRGNEGLRLSQREGLRSGDSIAMMYLLSFLDHMSYTPPRATHTPPRDLPRMPARLPAVLHPSLFTWEILTKTNFVWKVHVGTQKNNFLHRGACIPYILRWVQ